MFVQFTKTALNDLEQIIAFIALDNPTRTKKFRDELLEKSLEIGQNPMLYSALKERKEFRKKSYKGYIILYRILEDGVEINHFFNSMRDYSKLLK